MLRQEKNSTVRTELAPYNSTLLNSTSHPKVDDTGKEAQCELIYIFPIHKVAVSPFLNDSTVLQFINITGKLFHSSITIIEKKYVKMNLWL